MEDRKRLDELVSEINMYQGQADILKQQIENINATLSELTIAGETLETIKGIDKTETLVPIGAGSFIITEIKNTDEVIVGLGAGVAAKKKIDEADKSISEQKEELEKIIKKMVEDLQKINEIIVQKSPEAEELLKKIEKREN
jgi:prefoldin alpha subunit